MSEEEEGEYTLQEDEVQAVIDWAVSTGAMIILMDNAPNHSNTEEGITRLEGYIEAIEMMFNNMPDVIVGPAAEIAQASLEEAVEEEDQVEQFRREIENL